MIKDKFENIKIKHQEFCIFWQRYPYKFEGAIFGKYLKEFSEMVERIDIVLKRKDPSDILSYLISEVEACEKKLEILNNLKEELYKKWIFRLKLAEFIKNFTLLEILLSSIYIIFHYFPISQNIKNFLNFPSFILISFLILIISIFISHFKYYE